VSTRRPKLAPSLSMCGASALASFSPCLWLQVCRPALGGPSTLPTAMTGRLSNKMRSEWAWAGAGGYSSRRMSAWDTQSDKVGVSIEVPSDC
jgi:hypothetical protein